jgi:5-methyltetrahydrofolate--homocysteine methyltransferase
MYLTVRFQLKQNPFFQTWELRGRYPNRGYPKIFDDQAVGAEAKKLFNDAQELMKEIIANKSLHLKGVVGLFPANSTNDGEDVLIYASEEDREAGKTLDQFCMLRQQAEKESDGKR